MVKEKSHLLYWMLDMINSWMDYAKTKYHNQRIQNDTDKRSVPGFYVSYMHSIATMFI
jgi:hypothetical protein